MRTFCTISTVSHLFKTFALADSIANYGSQLKVLVTDSDDFPSFIPDSVQLFHLQSIDLDDVGIQKKYKNHNDKLRWGLKSIWIKYLLQQEFEEVLYVDNDVFFYSDPSFLFDLFQENHFLLTPHFYASDPYRNQNWFEANFRVGLFNAGFIGVSRKGIPILEWWSGCCLYNIKKSYWRGLFDDQKYLDLIPILFDGVKIVKQEGCNLAGWNYKNYHVNRTDNQGVLVQGKPIVFIHFASISLLEFSGKSSVFYTEYQQYLNAIRRYESSFEFRESRWEKRNVRAFFYYLRWRFVRIIEK